jgi:hypothetical protein
MHSLRSVVGEGRTSHEHQGQGDEQNKSLHAFPPIVDQCQHMDLANNLFASATRKNSRRTNRSRQDVPSWRRPKVAQPVLRTSQESPPMLCRRP